MIVTFYQYSTYLHSVFEGMNGGEHDIMMLVGYFEMSMKKKEEDCGGVKHLQNEREPDITRVHQLTEQ